MRRIFASVWRVTVAVGCLMLDAWDVSFVGLPRWRIVAGLVFLILSINHFSEVAYREDAEKTEKSKSLLP